VHDRSQVSPLTHGQEVWVLARGNDHRGGTWFDEREEVVWLLAYRRHRSGASDDFFPYCKGLDRDDRLLPTPDDYERLFRDRDRRFVDAVRIEAPLLLKDARGQPGHELRAMLGGHLGACVSVEVADDLEATTIALRSPTVEWGHLEVILAAFHPTPDWEQTDRLPSRDLAEDEVAFVHHHHR
jgi:hypothetical protein